MDNHNSEKAPLSLTEGIDTPLAKLSMPRLARGVARTRLHKLLDEMRDKAVVWISAPGGAGKTTLVATYITERKLPYLWYQIDKDDADPATFFYYLGLAAKKAQPNRDVHLPLLTPEYLPDIPGFARRYFCNLFAQLPQGIVLVFDNYQEISTAGIFNEILRSAMAEVPADAGLVVVSRIDPPPELDAPARIGWQDLQLTRDETEAIASRMLKFDPEVVRAMHERSEGWVAGLVLLMEQMKRKGDIKQVSSASSLETVFDFFASEFFDHLPETTQDFLLKTAMLSHMTATLAATVSGNRNAGEILADLHRRHFFTNRRDLSESSYQYHALFREFLLSRAAQVYEPVHYEELMCHAGRSLGEHGRREEAVALFLQAQDWEAATGLLLEQTPQLLAQGRAQIVAGWIKQMPKELVKDMPWLLYWLGVSQQFVNPYLAKDTLEQAYASFVQAQDEIGQMLAASAIIDIFYFLRQNLFEAVPWVEVLQDRLSAYPIFPFSELETRVLTSLFSILLFHRPHDPQLPYYAGRLMELLNGDLDINLKVMLSGHLLHYYVLADGDLERCEQLFNSVRPLLSLPEVSAMNRVVWGVAQLLPCVLAGKANDASNIVSVLYDKLDNNDLPYLEFIIVWYIAFAHLNFEGVSAPKSLFDRMDALGDLCQPLDLGLYYLAKCWHMLVRGDYDSAFRYGQTALRANSDVGASLIMFDARCMVAISCCEIGRPEQAHDYLTLPDGSGPRLRHQALLIEAYSYLLQGNQERCHERLAEAFSIGHANRYFGCNTWFSEIMSRICSEALHAEIEVEHVRELILKRDIPPYDMNVECWPWPVKIYTLGQFKLIIDDEPIAATKAQRRPLNLLMVLISLGGSDVKAERIMEVLWPEAEGDAAVSSFTTTLSRLRKLIGAETITVRDGRVSLNKRRCWVDIWALDHDLERSHTEDAGPAVIQAAAEKILALYRGPFLSDEEGEWSRSPRSRLQAKFSRCLSQYCRALLERGEGSQSVLLLERALEVESGVEIFYRDLMVGYAALGRVTEALAIYARCQDILPRDYGISPSQEIEIPYRDIKDSHSSKPKVG